MVLTYSSEWQGFRWDVERLISDLFTFTDNVAATWISGIKCEPFVPKDDSRESWLAQDNAFILVHRNGGNINQQTYVDNAIVTIGALSKSRDDSNELQSFIATILTAYAVELGGGTVKRRDPHRCGLSTTFMTVPGEVVGPQLNPEQLRDSRLVPSVWQINADVPRGLPDYRELLGLDTQ